jgi:hypothetical protein
LALLEVFNTGEVLEKLMEILDEAFFVVDSFLESYSCTCCSTAEFFVFLSVFFFEVLSFLFESSDFFCILMFGGRGGGKAVVVFFKFVICGAELVDFLLKIEKMVVGFLNEFFYNGEVVSKGAVGVCDFVGFVEVIFPVNQGGKIVRIGEGCLSLLGGSFVFKEVECPWDGG